MKPLVWFVLCTTLVACSSKPGEKSPPSNDPWKDYGLDGQTAEGDEPEFDEPVQPEPSDPGLGTPADPPPTVDELPRIDPTPSRTRPGQRFDQTLSITQSSGSQTIYSTFEILNDLVRQDDYADEERTELMTSEIRRGGGILRLDHGSRKQSFAPSAFEELNDPSVVFYFQDLKSKKKWQASRTATYEGVECDIYEKPAPARLQQTDFLWVAKRPAGFLLRYSSKNLLGIESVMTRTRPQDVPIDPSRFEAPAGYSR